MVANNPEFYAVPVETAVNALTALLNNGFLRIYSGAQPAIDAALTGTRLANLTFGATAFAGATASGGVVTATANAIGSDTNAVAGTAGYFALVKSDGTTVVMTGSVGLSGADLNLSALTFAAGATIACSAFSITQAE